MRPSDSVLYNWRMDTAPLPLPAEIVHALAANGGQPLLFEHPDTLQVYKLSKEHVEIALDDEYVNRMLAEGIAAVDAGQVVPWDPERIKQEGRRLLAQRRAQQ
jgi:hypothetical protein